MFSSSRRWQHALPSSMLVMRQEQVCAWLETVINLHMTDLIKFPDWWCSLCCDESAWIGSVLNGTCGMLCRGQLCAHLRHVQRALLQPKQPTACRPPLLRLSVPRRATQPLQTCRQ